MRWKFGKTGPGIIAQAALAMATLLVLAFAPPAHGRMLVASIDGQPIADAMLIRARAVPLASGPLPGSRIVEGDRRLLFRLLLSHGIITVAAPAPACISPVDQE